MRDIAVKFQAEAVAGITSPEGSKRRIREWEYGRGEDGQVAVGRAILQDTLAGRASMRARQDRIERTPSQSGARSPGRGPAASEERRRRVSGGGAGAERNARPGAGCPDALPGERGQ